MNTQSRLHHPADENSVFTVTLASNASTRYAGFMMCGRAILSQTAADAWSTDCDNNAAAEVYAFLSALRSLNNTERLSTRRIVREGIRNLAVFSTRPTAIFALNRIADGNVDKCLPEWLQKRIETISNDLGVVLNPILVNPDDNKFGRTYGYLMRIARLQKEQQDTESPHKLPTAYSSLDIRLNRPDLYKARKQQRETATAPKPLTPSYEAVTT